MTEGQCGVPLYIWEEGLHYFGGIEGAGSLHRKSININTNITMLFQLKYLVILIQSYSKKNKMHGFTKQDYSDRMGFRSYNDATKFLSITSFLSLVEVQVLQEDSSWSRYNSVRRKKRNSSGGTFSGSSK